MSKEPENLSNNDSSAQNAKPDCFGKMTVPPGTDIIINEDSKLKLLEFIGTGSVTSDGLSQISIKTVKIGSKKIDISEFGYVIKASVNAHNLDIFGKLYEDQSNHYRSRTYTLENCESVSPIGGCNDHIAENS